MIGKGVIMDAGANDGYSSLQLATQFPDREIWSVEPIESNIRAMHKKLAAKANIRILHGALGEKREFGKYPDFMNKNSAGTGTQIGALPNYRNKLRRKDHMSLFPVYTIDDLFGKKYRLAFGHWDLEGNEVYLLKGADRTIRRDRPLFTVETFPRQNATRHAELLRQTQYLGYKCVEVKESCGVPKDCRNFMCAPNEIADRVKCPS